MALPFTSTVENLYNLMINIQQIPQDCDLNYMKFNSNTLGQEVRSEIKKKKNYLLRNATFNAVFSLVSLVLLLFVDL